MSSSTPSARIALVTGGAQGIGEAVAKQLARDGLDVAVTDIPAKQAQLEAVAAAIRATGRRALVVTGDVTVEADVEAMVKGTVDALGGLDVVRPAFELALRDQRRPCRPRARRRPPVR